jgi:hypothetical protein
MPAVADTPYEISDRIRAVSLGGEQRLCGSGMKWTGDGAAVVLSLRALSYTPERWSQFWSKVDRWGFPVAA